MQLEVYQVDVLKSLSRYLRELNAWRERAEKIPRILAEQGEKPDPSDYCEQTWQALHNEKTLPLLRDQHGTLVPPRYVARKDGLHRPVPNLCLKIPTGGGKTLLAAVAVERINVISSREVGDVAAGRLHKRTPYRRRNEMRADLSAWVVGVPPYRPRSRGRSQVHCAMKSRVEEGQLRRA